MKTKNILFYLIGLLLFSSCDDMFEPAKENTRQLEAMVQETDYVYGLLIYGYTRLPYLRVTTTMMLLPTILVIIIRRWLSVHGHQTVIR